MATSIQATGVISLNTAKTTDPGDATATRPSTRLNLGDNSISFNNSSSPDGVDSWSGTVTMVAGTATIDLTSLTQAGLTPAIDMTGKKLRVVRVIADPTNLAVVALGTGGANGYTAFGSISNLKPGDDCLRTTTAPIAIDGTHKTLDLTGSLVDKANIHLVFGT